MLLIGIDSSHCSEHLEKFSNTNKFRSSSVNLSYCLRAKTKFATHDTLIIHSETFLFLVCEEKHHGIYVDASVQSRPVRSWHILSRPTLFDATATNPKCVLQRYPWQWSVSHFMSKMKWQNNNILSFHSVNTLSNAITFSYSSLEVTTIVHSSCYICSKVMHIE